MDNNETLEEFDERRKKAFNKYINDCDKAKGNLKELNFVGVFEKLPKAQNFKDGDVVVIPTSIHKWENWSKWSNKFSGYSFYLCNKLYNKRNGCENGWSLLVKGKNTYQISKIQKRYDRKNKDKITIKQVEKILYGLCNLREILNNEYYYNFLSYEERNVFYEAKEIINKILRDAEDDK